MNAEILPILKLSTAEKLQILEDLWDNIAAEPDKVPLYDWQKEELDRRKAAHLKNPESADSWDEAR